MAKGSYIPYDSLIRLRLGLCTYWPGSEIQYLGTKTGHEMEGRPCKMIFNSSRQHAICLTVLCIHWRKMHSTCWKIDKFREKESFWVKVLWNCLCHIRREHTYWGLRSDALWQIGTPSKCKIVNSESSETNKTKPHICVNYTFNVMWYTSYHY